MRRKRGCRTSNRGASDDSAGGADGSAPSLTVVSALGRIARASAISASEASSTSRRTAGASTMARHSTQRRMILDCTYSCFAERSGALMISAARIRSHGSRREWLQAASGSSLGIISSAMGDGSICECPRGE